MKICVYAICKNEEKFAERWYRSMQEADWVVALDTGSEDRTVEILRSLGAVVQQRRISPWRFDAARNASMELIPPEADICVCTDLDEEFEPGWRAALEKAWLPGSIQARYRYTWNFHPDGSEGTVFWIEKIHANEGFRWIHPVHEILQYSGEKPLLSVQAEGVRLYHRADPGKSRAQYLHLLELSVQEEPDDDRNRHYLGREYFFHQRWDDCISTLLAHLRMPSATWPDERCASMRYIAQAYLQKGEYAPAHGWLLRAISEAPYLREPYVEMGKLLYARQQWEGMVYFLRCALEIAQRPETYICDAEAWGSLPYDLLALAHYALGQYAEAARMGEKALSLSPNDSRLQENLHLYLAKLPS